MARVRLNLCRCSSKVPKDCSGFGSFYHTSPKLSGLFTSAWRLCYGIRIGQQHRGFQEIDTLILCTMEQLFGQHSFSNGVLKLVEWDAGHARGLDFTPINLPDKHTFGIDIMG